MVTCHGISVTDDHRYVPSFMVTITSSFPLSWHHWIWSKSNTIEQELLTCLQHLTLPPGFGGVRNCLPVCSTWLHPLVLVALGTAYLTPPHGFEIFNVVQKRIHFYLYYATLHRPLNRNQANMYILFYRDWSHRLIYCMIILSLQGLKP